MTRIGLMGCGVVAQYGHLPAIKQVPALGLHAVYDPDPQQVRRTQEAFDVPYGFTDAEAFFRSGIEAVSITSPAPAHRENVLGAARHGLHVLCEKPLAMSRDEAAEMIAAMEAAGRLLFVAFCYRFSPAALKIREFIRSSAIGEARSLRLLYLWDMHGKYQRPRIEERILQQRRVGRMLEGGPMFDCGTHQIDLARWWLGSEVLHQAGHGAWCDEYDVPDHVWAHLTHVSGAHTMVEISYSYCHTAREPLRRFTYEIIGSDGMILYDRELKVFEVRGPAGTQQLNFTEEKNFTGMYEAFAQAVQTGKPGDLCTARDGEIVTGIALETTAQAMRGRGARTQA
jgi:predicted dehydrogenase